MRFSHCCNFKCYAIFFNQTKICTRYVLYYQKSLFSISSSRGKQEKKEEHKIVARNWLALLFARPFLLTLLRRRDYYKDRYVYNKLENKILLHHGANCSLFDKNHRSMIFQVCVCKFVTSCLKVTSVSKINKMKSWQKQEPMSSWPPDKNKKKAVSED